MSKSAWLKIQENVLSLYLPLAKTVDSGLKPLTTLTTSALIISALTENIQFQLKLPRTGTLIYLITMHMTLSVYLKLTLLKQKHLHANKLSVLIEDLSILVTMTTISSSLLPPLLLTI